MLNISTSFMDTVHHYHFGHQWNFFFILMTTKAINLDSLKYYIGNNNKAFSVSFNETDLFLNSAWNWFKHFKEQFSLKAWLTCRLKSSF